MAIKRTFMVNFKKEKNIYKKIKTENNRNGQKRAFGPKKEWKETKPNGQMNNDAYIMCI